MVYYHQMEIHHIRMTMQCNRGDGKAVCKLMMFGRQGLWIHKKKHCAHLKKEMA